jgi:chitin synthase
LAARTILQAFGNAVLTSLPEVTPVTAVPIDVPKYMEVISIVLDGNSSRKRINKVRFQSLNLDVTSLKAVENGKPVFPILAYLLRGIDSNTRIQNYLLPDGFTSPPIAAAGAAGGNSVFPQEKQIFSAITEAIGTLGLRQKELDGIWRVLSAILHLGSMQFCGASERGKGTHEKKNSAFVKNVEVLEAASGLLCISPQFLEDLLTTAIRIVDRDRVSVLLNATEALERTQSVMVHLYRTVFVWLQDTINSKLQGANKKGSFKNKSGNGSSDICVALVQSPQPILDVDHVCGLMNNYIIESLDRYVQRIVFDTRVKELREQGLGTVQADLSFKSNEQVQFALFDDGVTGFVSKLNNATTNPDESRTWLSNCVKSFNGTKSEKNAAKNHESEGFLMTKRRGVAEIISDNCVTVNHSFGMAKYYSESMVQQNDDVMGEDIYLLLRGGPGRAGSSSVVIQDIFSERITDRVTGSGDGAEAEKLLGKKSKTRRAIPKRRTLANAINSEILSLLTELSRSVPRVVYCLAHAQDSTSSQPDASHLLNQVTQFQIQAQAAQLRAHPWLDLTVPMTSTALLERYRSLALPPVNGQSTILVSTSSSSGPATAEKILDLMRFSPGREYYGGKTYIFLSVKSWKLLEGVRRKIETERKKAASQLRKERKAMGIADDASSIASDSEYADSDVGDNESLVGESEDGSASVTSGNTDANGSSKISSALAPKGEKASEDVQELELTPKRKRWLAFVWLMTWWIPDTFVKSCGGMDRPDIRMAWREKVTICCAIFWTCAIQMFIIIGLGRIICPKQNLLNLEELYFKGTEKLPMVGIYGNFFKISDFVEFGTYHPENALLSVRIKNILTSVPTLAHF